MGRKKKSVVEVELETEVPVEEVTEESSESDFESEEAQSLAENETPEVEASEEEAVEEKVEKPKRQRRSRKAKPEVEAAEEEVIEAIADAEEEVAPKKAARSKAKPSEEKNEKVDPVPMFNQWKTLQEITASIAANFERIHRQMNDLQANYLETSERLAKQAPSKPPALTKVAMGVAMFSVVISLLSLSFAQSVRSNALAAASAVNPRHAQSMTAEAPSLAFNEESVIKNSKAPSKKRPFSKIKK